MSVELYEAGYEYAKRQIAEGHYVADKGDWSEANPGTAAQDAFIEEHGLKAYADWHLGIKPDRSYEDKSTYDFPYGDYHVVHRAGLLAAEERAQQYNYLPIRDAARQLLQQLDQAAGMGEEQPGYSNV